MNNGVVQVGCFWVARGKNTLVGLTKYSESVVSEIGESGEAANGRKREELAVASTASADGADELAAHANLQQLNEPLCSHRMINKIVI